MRAQAKASAVPLGRDSGRLKMVKPSCRQSRLGWLKPLRRLKPAKARPTKRRRMNGHAKGITYLQNAAIAAYPL